MATKKAKEARVEIVLPDGTKISARGPMAEQMARRLMDPQWRYWWPTWTSGYLATNGGADTAGVTVTYTDGNTANGTAVTVGSAVADALGGATVPKV